MDQKDAQTGTHASGSPTGNDRAFRRAFATALVGPNFLTLEGLKGILSAAGFRVVAPDMRGYNLSGKPADVMAYAPERLAASRIFSTLK